VLAELPNVGASVPETMGGRHSASLLGHDVSLLDMSIGAVLMHCASDRGVTGHSPRDVEAPQRTASAAKSKRKQATVKAGYGGKTESELQSGLSVPSLVSF
jgi:hypothetical protein